MCKLHFLQMSEIFWEVLDDMVKALDCTVMVSGDAIGAPDHTVMVLNGIVEE